LIHEIGLPDVDLEKVLYGNARRILGVGNPIKMRLPDSSDAKVRA